MLELLSDSLHTAAECYDGMEKKISHPDPLQQESLAVRCLETTTGGSFVENCSVTCNSSADCGNCETGNEHKVCVLPVSISVSQAGLVGRGLGPSEDGACPSPNTGRDEEETEPTGSTPHLSLLSGSQCELERSSLTVGIEPAAASSRQAEDSHVLEAVIQEGPEDPAGKQISEQEAEEWTSAELCPVHTDLEAASMGQGLSPQHGGNAGKELLGEQQKLCDGACLGGGLAASLSSPGNESCPLIEAGDVIAGPGSPGVHGRESPADISSLEQTQEAAVVDYTVEQKVPPAAGPAGGWSEAGRAKELDGENAPEVPGSSPEILPTHHEAETLGPSMEGPRTDTPLDTMPSEGGRPADPGGPRGLTRGDDCSAQEGGSSTAEIITEERDRGEARMAAVEEEEEEQNDWKPEENLLQAEVGSSFKLESALKTCTHIKRTGEEAHPDAPTEETGLAPPSEGTETSESEPGESGSAEADAETADVDSEVPDGNSFPSEVIGAGEEGVQPAGISNNLALRQPGDRLMPPEDGPQPSDHPDPALEPASSTHLTSRPPGEGHPEAAGGPEGAPQAALQGE